MERRTFMDGQVFALKYKSCVHPSDPWLSLIKQNNGKTPVCTQLQLLYLNSATDQ